MWQNFLGVLLIIVIFGPLIGATLYGLIRRRPKALSAVTMWWLIGFVIQEFGMPVSWRRSLAHLGSPLGVDSDLYFQGLMTAGKFGFVAFLVTLPLSIALYILIHRGLYGRSSNPDGLKLAAHVIILILLLRALLTVPVACLFAGVSMWDGFFLFRSGNGLVDGLSYTLATSPYLILISTIMLLAIRRGFPKEASRSVKSPRSLQDQLGVSEKSEVCAD